VRFYAQVGVLRSNLHLLYSQAFTPHLPLNPHTSPLESTQKPARYYQSKIPVEKIESRDYLLLKENITTSNESEELGLDAFQGVCGTSNIVTVHSHYKNTAGARDDIRMYAYTMILR